MDTPSTVEKGGGGFEGITLLLCENPLPPLEEAIEAAQETLPYSNHYTEPYSSPLRDALSDHHGVAREHIHVNAGSELILRQLFERYGDRVHLLTPTYPLFPEIADTYTETRLSPEHDFRFDLHELDIPHGTTLVTLVNPNNPNGLGLDLTNLPTLLEEHPDTMFLVDEAFGDFLTDSATTLVPCHENLLVTRTFSKAHSLAGFRIGYAIAPEPITRDLNTTNDAYPLARPSQAAALATLTHYDQIQTRIKNLRDWAKDLASALQDRGVTTYPSETYFFLADFHPHDATTIADGLREHDIYAKPLDDPHLGPGFMRLTTARPRENDQLLAAFDHLL